MKWLAVAVVVLYLVVGAVVSLPYAVMASDDPTSEWYAPYLAWILLTLAWGPLALYVFFPRFWRK